MQFVLTSEREKKEEPRNRGVSPIVNLIRGSRPPMVKAGVGVSGRVRTRERRQKRMLGGLFKERYQKSEESPAWLTQRERLRQKKKQV